MKSNNSLSSIFNVATDPGVQLSIGNTVLFWAGGGVPQVMSLGATITNIALKSYSEFSSNPQGILAHPAATYTAVAGVMSVISGHALLNETYLPAAAAGAFALGNASLAGILKPVKEALSDAFGRACAQISTKMETFVTLGLGAVAYMSAGDLALSLPFVEAGIPTSMLTFIPTLIGGGISAHNAITGKDEQNGNPVLWMASGMAATGAVGLINDAVLPGIANCIFSSAYLKIHNLDGAGDKPLENSTKKMLKCD